MLRKPPFPYEMYKNMDRLVLTLVSRDEWGAKPATKEEQLSEMPVKNIVFGYTETEPCTDKESCIKLMKELQEQHMSEGQTDVRYSFVVGADGNVYEGRGSKVKAGHHYRFPDLNGENYEIVHTQKRGSLPDPELSAVAWQYLEKLEYEGLIFIKPNYFQDYEDPPTPVDLDSLIYDTGNNVLDNLNRD